MCRSATCRLRNGRLRLKQKTFLRHMYVVLEQNLTRDTTAAGASDELACRFGCKACHELRQVKIGVNEWTNCYSVVCLRSNHLVSRHLTDQVGIAPLWLHARASCRQLTFFFISSAIRRQDIGAIRPSSSPHHARSSGTRRESRTCTAEAM